MYEDIAEPEIVDVKSYKGKIIGKYVRLQNIKLREYRLN
jgi:hypothetical protein